MSTFDSTIDPSLVALFGERYFVNVFPIRKPLVKPLSNLLALIVHVQYNLRQSWSGVSRSSGKDISVRFHILALLLVALPTVTFAEDEGSTKEKLEETVELNATLDQTLPKYVPLAEKTSGTFEVHCSPITIALVKQWARAFEAIYPQVHVKVERVNYTNDHSLSIINEPSNEIFACVCESSGIVAVALDKEYHESNWPVIVALDQLEIIVHPKNATKKLHANQLAWIYTEPGHVPRISIEEQIQSLYQVDVNAPDQEGLELLLHPCIDRWEEVNPTNPPSVGIPMHLYSRYTFEVDFTFLALRTAGYPSTNAHLKGQRHGRDDLRIVDDAAAMVRAVADDPLALGFVSHSVDLSRVHTVTVEGDPVDISGLQNHQKEPFDVELPLMARPIFLWVAPSNNPERTSAKQEFLKFILSQDGQKVVADHRFFPLPADLAAKQLKPALKTPEPPARVNAAR